ncbi:uncharacterized protein LOC104003980 [Pan troglodytes]|uniref:uncharacterized protein LOC104003980 n=1 Tax=Pan troglodytes TaxID=9598 RepID=UPI0030139033
MAIGPFPFRGKGGKGGSGFHPLHFGLGSAPWASRSTPWCHRRGHFRRGGPDSAAGSRGARSNGASRKGRRPRDRGVTCRVVGDRLGIPGRLRGMSGWLGLVSSLHRLLVSPCTGGTVGLQRRKRLKSGSSRMSFPVTRRPREQTPHPDIVAGTSGLLSKVAALFSIPTGQENI